MTWRRARRLVFAISVWSVLLAPGVTAQRGLDAPSFDSRRQAAPTHPIEVLLTSWQDQQAPKERELFREPHNRFPIVVLNPSLAFDGELLHYNRTSRTSNFTAYLCDEPNEPDDRYSPCPRSQEPCLDDDPRCWVETVSVDLPTLPKGVARVLVDDQEVVRDCDARYFIQWYTRRRPPELWGFSQSFGLKDLVKLAPKGCEQ